MGSGHSLAAAQGAHVANEYLSQLGEDRDAIKIGDEMVEFVRQRGDQVGEWTGQKEELWFGKREERKALSAEQYRLAELKEKKRLAREARLAKVKAAEEAALAAAEAEADELAAASGALPRKASKHKSYSEELERVAGSGQRVEWRRHIARSRANAALYIMASQAISKKWDDAANYITGIPAMMDAILGTHRDRELFLGWAIKLRRTEEAMRMEVMHRIEETKAELHKMEEAVASGTNREARLAIGEGGEGESGATVELDRIDKYKKDNEGLIKALDAELQAKRKLAESALELLDVLEEMAARDAKMAKMSAAEIMAEVNKADSGLDEDLKSTIYQMDRANHSSMRRLRYDLPHVHSLEVMGNSTGYGDERTKYMSTLVAKEKLKAMFEEGKVAFQFLANGEKWEGEDGEVTDMYMLDPWDVIKLFYTHDKESDLEGIVRGERIDGLAFGPRLLLQLVAAVKEYAGEEAAQKIAVVIHCHPKAEQFIVADLAEREFYGLRPQNVLILTQPALCGYKIDVESKRFVECRNGESRPLGSGFALRQLTWPSHAYFLDSASAAEVKDSKGNGKGKSKSKGKKIASHRPRFRKCYIQEDAITYLEEEGFELLSTLRCTDISRYMARNALDTDFLAWFIKLQHEVDARMGVDVQKVGSVKEIRKVGSIVLRKHSTRNPSFDVQGLLSPGFAAAVADGKSAGQRIEASGMGVGYLAVNTEEVVVSSKDVVFPEAEPFVADIKSAQMHHVSAHKMLHQLVKTGGGKNLLAGTDRYVYSLKNLRSVITGEGASNPVLSIRGGSFYATISASDVTLGKESRAVAIKGNSPMVKLSGNSLDHESVKELTAVLQAQDGDLSFKRMANEYESRVHPARLKVNGREMRHRVLFVAVGDLVACEKAIGYVGRMLLPGVDEVHFITLASTRDKVPQALRFLSSLELEDCFIDVHRETRVQSDYDNEADAVAAYADSIRATLVVIPTRGASSKEVKFARLRDLHFLKAIFTRPVLLVKDDHWIPNEFDDVTQTIVRSSLRSKGLVQFLGTLLRQRQDTVVIAVYEKDHSGDAKLREGLVDMLIDTCSSNGIRSTSHYIQGSNYNRALSSAAGKLHAEIVAVVAPKSHRTEDDFTAFLDSQTSHVLVWRYDQT